MYKALDRSERRKRRCSLKGGGQRDCRAEGTCRTQGWTGLKLFCYSLGFWKSYFSLPAEGRRNP